jgi:phosphoglycolate phosphatase-like HAD superfamily hydrolase
VRGRGLKLGLISNLAAPYKKPFYRHGLAACFDGILFSCEIGLRKPEPAVYLRIAKELGINPEGAVMVGDSLRCDSCGADSARSGEDRVFLTGDQHRVAICDWCVGTATGFIERLKAKKKDAAR